MNSAPHLYNLRVNCFKHGEADQPPSSQLMSKCLVLSIFLKIFHKFQEIDHKICLKIFSFFYQISYIFTHST